MFTHFLQKAKPHLIVIGIFLVISVAYCYPILQGKILNQNDDITAKALMVEANEFIKKNNEYVPWTTRMFSGMPVSAGDGGGITNISYKIVYVLTEMFNGSSFDIIFWCMVGMYVFLFVLGMDIKLAALGAFIFAFSSFNILSLEAGHVQKLLNFAYLPMLLAGLLLVFRKKYVWGFALAAISINYQIVIGHYQVTYYAAICSVFTAVFFGIYYLVKKETTHILKSAGILAAAAILGMLPNIGVLNNYYLSHETTRGAKSELTPTPGSDINQEGSLGYDYATAWSYGRGESFSFLVPNAYGGGGTYFAQDQKSNTMQAIMQNVKSNEEGQQFAQMTSSYWGEQPFVGGPMYFGAIVCFLFLFGAILIKSIEKWWIVGITLLFLFLSWGNNSIIYDLFFHYVPVFSKFRTPSMAIGIVQIGFAAMAVWGIYELNKIKDRKEIIKPLYISGGITLGLLILMWLVPGVIFDFTSSKETNLPDWFTSALITDRTEMFTKDVLRSLFFVAVAAVSVYYFAKNKLNYNVLFTVIAIFTLIDLWNFNTRYLNKDNFIKPSKLKQMTSPSPADLQILQDPDINYRVFNLTVSPFNDAITSYNHKSIGGYHGAKLRKYQELIERQIGRQNISVLSMLNTKYVIQNTENGPYPYTNPDACGASWIVPEIKWVDNADQEMAALNYDSSYQFEPKKYVVIQKKNAVELNNFKPQFDPTASVVIKEINPKYIKYESNAASDQMGVFSEMFYIQEDGDGWRSYIDGNEVPHYRVNYVLRGMKIPSGKHLIEFKFDYSQSKLRNDVGFGFMLLMFGIVITVIVMDYRKKQAQKN